MARTTTRSNFRRCGKSHGNLRIRRQGSAGGHNGLESVTAALATEHFARLRMGIGQPKDKYQVVSYVLEEFTKGERADLDEFVRQASECCLLWVRKGMAKSMDQFNRKR